MNWTLDVCRSLEVLDVSVDDMRVLGIRTM